MFLMLVAALSVMRPEGTPPQELAHCFVEAIEQRDLDALGRVVATRTSDYTRLVKRLGSYDCVSVRSYAVEIDEGASEAALGARRWAFGVHSVEAIPPKRLTPNAQSQPETTEVLRGTPRYSDQDTLTLRLTIDATATTAGATRRPIPFPRHWYLETVRHKSGWRIEKAYTREWAIADELVVQRSLQPWAFVDAAMAPDVDPELLIEELATIPENTWTLDSRPVLLVARDFARTHGMALSEVSALLALSIDWRKRGDRKTGLKLANEALDVAAQSELPDAIALANLAVGTIDGLNGHEDEAMDRYGTAAAMLERADDARPSLKAKFMRGTLLLRRGAIRESLLVSASVAADAERFGWTEGPCAAGMLSSDAYTALRDLATAHSLSDDALRCSMRLGDVRTIELAVVNLMLLESALGNRAQAAAFRDLLLQTSVEALSPAQFAAARMDLADALAQDGRYRDAERELLRSIRKARDGRERVIEALALERLARVRLLDGRPPEALEAAEEADTILRDDTGSVAVGVLSIDPSWSVRATLGSALQANGRLEEAIETLQSSVELIEAQRAALAIDDLTLSGFMTDKAQPYRQLAALLVDAGRLPEAVIVSERLRARALGQAVARGTIDRLPAMSDDDRRHHDALNASIAAANRKLLLSRHDERNAALRAELEEERLALRRFLFDLYARRPDIRRRNVDDPRTIVEESDRLLPHDGEVLLTFMVGEERTFAFLIERDANGCAAIAVHQVKAGEAELERRVRRFVAQVEGRGLDYGTGARALFRELLGPFAERIASRRLLYVVPDGILWRLPFQALQDARGRHLIERVAIAYAPSLALLRNQRPEEPEPRAAGGLLALADPLLPMKTRVAARTTLRKELVPLPEARVEARTIAKFYDDSEVLIGAEATEEAAKRLAAGYRILHVATHGIIDDSAPMYSALLLTATGTDDGLLEAREMIDLHLGADLAILSACESGGGGLAPGEGMIGMSWALMVAGCRNTVVSQWDVASNSTAKLMIAFHRALRDGGDYAEALRTAQLELMKSEKFRHPFYWSPFVLISTSQ